MCDDLAGDVLGVCRNLGSWGRRQNLQSAYHATRFVSMGKSGRLLALLLGAFVSGQCDDCGRNALESPRTEVILWTSSIRC